MIGANPVTCSPPAMLSAPPAPDHTQPSIRCVRGEAERKTDPRAYMPGPWLKVHSGTSCATSKKCQTSHQSTRTLTMMKSMQMKSVSGKVIDSDDLRCVDGGARTPNDAPFHVFNAADGKAGAKSVGGSATREVRDHNNLAFTYSNGPGVKRGALSPMNVEGVDSAKTKPGGSSNTVPQTAVWPGDVLHPETANLNLLADTVVQDSL
jgi:hypothetical protein